MRHLAAAIIWCGTSLPAAYLLTHKSELAAGMLAFFGWGMACWVMSQVEDR